MCYHELGYTNTYKERHITEIEFLVSFGNENYYSNIKKGFYISYHCPCVIEWVGVCREQINK